MKPNIIIIFMNSRFIDGSSYFEAVADALEKAKEEIFITDWWSVYNLFHSLPHNINFEEPEKEGL